MRRELGFLAWLTVAFVGGLTVLALSISSVSNSNAAGGGLGWAILLGFFFLLALVGCTLTALSLGITESRAAQQQQRWGWFVGFLALTVLADLGMLTYLLATFGVWSLRLSPPAALFLLIGPPLALVTASFLFRSVLVAREGDKTTPASPGE